MVVFCDIFFKSLKDIKKKILAIIYQTKKEYFEIYNPVKFGDNYSQVKYNNSFININKKLQYSTWQVILAIETIGI